MWIASGMAARYSEATACQFRIKFGHLQGIIKNKRNPKPLPIGKSFGFPNFGSPERACAFLGIEPKRKATVASSLRREIA